MEETLWQRIEAYPELLFDVLEERTKWGREVTRLQEQEEEQKNEENIDQVDFELERNLAKLNAKIEKLEIKLDQAKGEVEVVHRAENPKATESSSKAAVLSSGKVADIKLELADLVEQKKLLEIDIRDKQSIATMERMKRRMESQKPTPIRENSELEYAQRKWYEATANVKKVKAMLQCYELLVKLEK